MENKYHSKGKAWDFEVFIDPVDCHGYFEHNSLGDILAGTLTVSRNDDGELLLCDFDGTHSLPSKVREELIKMGIRIADAI